MSLVDDFFKYLHEAPDTNVSRPFASKKLYARASVDDPKLETDHATELQLRYLMDDFESTHTRNRHGGTDVFLDFLDQQKEMLLKRAATKLPPPWTSAPKMFSDEAGLQMFLQHTHDSKYAEQSALMEKTSEDWKVPKRFAAFLIDTDKSKWLPFTPAKLADASKELHYCVMCGQHYRPVDRFNCPFVSGRACAAGKNPPNTRRAVFYALHTDESDIAEVLLQLLAEHTHPFYSNDKQGMIFTELFNNYPLAFFDMTPRCSVFGEFDNPVMAPKQSIFLNEREWTVNINSYEEFARTKRSILLPGDLAEPLQGAFLDTHLLFTQTVASYIELDKMWGQKENFLAAEKQPRSVPEKYFVPLTITRRLWIICDPQ